MIRKTSQKRKPASKRKVMDLLARGNRTKLELTQKLEALEYTSNEIEEAIAYAEQNKWLSDPEELAQHLTEALSRKKKSAGYIDQFLESKGLPAPEVDPDAELEKALDIVQSKLSKHSGFDDEEKLKIYRLLTNRGFDSDTIEKITERK